MIAPPKACPRCKSPRTREIDHRERIEVVSCHTCGYIEYPGVDGNALCPGCGRGFRKRGRATMCADCHATARLKPRELRQCAGCGKDYVPRRTDQRYCSARCNARAAYHRTRTQKYCQLCGDPIEKYGSKYCSAECRETRWLAENKDRIAANARRYYEAHRDEHNARSLERYRNNTQKRKAQDRAWRQRNPEKRKAYKQAYYQRHRERMREQERERARRKSASVVRVCAGCGTEYPPRRGRTRYCVACSAQRKATGAAQ